MRFHHQRQAVLVLQTRWRAVFGCVRYRETLEGIVRVQAVARRHLTYRACRGLLVEQETVRCEARRDRAARVIQRALGSEQFMAWLRGKREGQAAVVVQARLRGVQARQRSAKSRRIHRVRLKIAAAAERARRSPELRLGNKTREALKILMKARMLSQVSKAMQVLETSTRLSPVCCASFCAAGAAGTLLTFIRMCNRSLPHLQLLRLALLILKNVTRLHHLVPPGMEMIGGAKAGKLVEILVDIVQNFRDKESVFVVAVGLVSDLASRNRGVLTVCRSPEVRRRVTGVLVILERVTRVRTRKSSVGHKKHDTSELDIKLKACLQLQELLALVEKEALCGSY
eukprot:CAMPEP_0185752224 /NCGR_PEP_ID=MMETSP1174-20130828/11031_1 /TAXON_ID=35687 /ORGANISM="Dictyocha speculum, Strain CCMP1381" /LENGTH=341 /DNA_ID=CAMNT_0028429585 /DNA_START=115 /DNA_END=1140 /DNA_ORIENTATION=+